MRKQLQAATLPARVEQLSPRLRKKVRKAIQQVRWNPDGEIDETLTEKSVTLGQRRMMVQTLHEEGVTVVEMEMLLDVPSRTVYNDIAWYQEQLRRGISQEMIGRKWWSSIRRLENHALWCHGMSEKATEHKDKVFYRGKAIDADSRVSEQLGKVITTEAVARWLMKNTEEETKGERETEKDVRNEAAIIAADPRKLAELFVAFVEVSLLPRELIAAINMNAGNGNPPDGDGRDPDSTS